MSAPPKTSFKKSAFLPREGVGGGIKVVGEEIDSGIVKRDAVGRPSNRSGGRRPNLNKARRNLNGETPAPDDAANDSGTHHINEKMLADEYRRGLRVGSFRSVQAQSLDFLLGDDDITL